MQDRDPAGSVDDGRDHHQQAQQAQGSRGPVGQRQGRPQPMGSAVPPAGQGRPVVAGAHELDGDDDAGEQGDADDGGPGVQPGGAGEAGQGRHDGRGGDDGRPGRRPGGVGAPHAEPGPARLHQGESQQRQAEHAVVLGGQRGRAPEAEAPQGGPGVQGVACAEDGRGVEAGGRLGHGDRRQHHHQPDQADRLDPHAQGPQGPGRQAGGSLPRQAQALTSPAS